MEALFSAFFHQISSASRILCRAPEWRNRQRGGAAERRRARAGLEIVARCGAAERHVEMRMYVDTARQTQHVRRRRLLCRRSPAECKARFRGCVRIHENVRVPGSFGAHQLAVANQKAAHSAWTPSAAVPWTSSGHGRAALLPTFKAQAVLHALHRDAAIDRADERTEIAADALGFIHMGDAVRGVRRLSGAPTPSSFGIGVRVGASDNRLSRPQMNALMRAVPAGDDAEFAADAFVFMNARHDLEIQIEVFPFRRSAG